LVEISFLILQKKNEKNDLKISKKFFSFQIALISLFKKSSSLTEKFFFRNFLKLFLKGGLKLEK